MGDRKQPRPLPTNQKRPAPPPPPPPKRSPERVVRFKNDATALQDRVLHIKDLVADPENRRKHNPRNIGMVVDALHEVGAGRSIVVDEGQVVLAGNGVIEAAAEAGITKVRIIKARGDEIIAVQRDDLTEEQKRKLAMYDNRAGELAEWNPEQLQADQAAGLDLKPWFTDKELAALVGKPTSGGGGDGEGASVDDLKSQFMIVINCQSEQEQVRLLERFSQEGIECKALVS